MPNSKEDVNAYKMYGKESMISKEEFIKKYQISEKRSFK